MELLHMRRHADDNEYLHKDFHASIDNAIAYIGDTFGEEALLDYLRQYVYSRYNPMTLSELSEYFKSIYAAEHYEDKLCLCPADKMLTVKIDSCPGIAYFHLINTEPSKWYSYTTTAMYKYLAELCNMDFSLAYYDEKTGKAEFSFTEKEV